MFLFCFVFGIQKRNKFRKKLIGHQGRLREKAVFELGSVRIPSLCNLSRAEVMMLVRKCTV